MNRHKLVFDPKSFSFRKAGVQTWRIVRNILFALFVSLTITVLAYFVFSLFYSTDEEKALYRENKMYEKVFPTLSPKEKLLEDVIAGLQYKDSEIYEQIFHSNAPNVDPMSRLDFLFASDTIPDTRMTSYTTAKSMELMEKSRAVDAAFERVFSALADPSLTMPPMLLPIKDISYPQIGASMGRKMSPFLKAYVYHNGLDLIVLRGTDVFAAADGVVTASDSDRSDGRFVEVTHAGGYVTRYCHLESADVRKGQDVKMGARIGSVGMSGNSFAPHLHYEIYRDGKEVDPVNFLFASIGPAEYANMLYMASNTLQSMD